MFSFFVGWVVKGPGLTIPGAGIRRNTLRKMKMKHMGKRKSFETDTCQLCRLLSFALKPLLFKLSSNISSYKVEHGHGAL